MLTFTLYNENLPRGRSEPVHIDPAAVIAARETERRPALSGYHQTAVITLVTGTEYVVEDGARRVAKEIREAREKQEAWASRTLWRPAPGGMLVAEIQTKMKDHEWQMLQAFVGYLDRLLGEQIESISVYYSVGERGVPTILGLVGC
jgi:hypothetical protein